MKFFHSKMVWFLALMVLVMPITNAYNFSDTENHWSEIYVNNLSHNRIIDSSKDNYRPDEPLIRAELVKLVTEASDNINIQQLPTESMFSDVPDGEWFSDYVFNAQAKNIVSGYQDGTFGPDLSITREEAVKIIVEAFDIPLDSGGKEISFTDLSEANWSENYIQIAVSQCVVNGYDDGTFRPKDQVTRGEVAKMIVRGRNYGCEQEENMAMNVDSEFLGKGGCFLPGTKVLMSSGEEQAIETIQNGDEVMSLNPNTGELEAQKVNKKFIHDDTNKEYLIINDSLRITPNHRVALNGVWQPIANAQKGDYLVLASQQVEIIESIEKVTSADYLTVYNLEVANNHNFYAENFLVHNDKGGGIGFSVGGAKDVNNFRENIQNDFLPQETDLTYEGFYYDYFFDTGQDEPCVELFCPSYLKAVSPDPLSGDLEHYLSVGLNSNIKAADFERKKLNLVIVLDVSGSMSSSFDEYYYDGTSGNQQPPEEFKSKMQVANESVIALLDHLDPDDRFGLVTFESSAQVVQELKTYGEYDQEELQESILAISEGGGTNMHAGMEVGTSLYADLEADSEYENRIIFLTDAMPNTGDISETGMYGVVKDNAVNNGIYSSFIGIGLDFNSELIEKISKTRGANYYSVHSEADFRSRMDEQFDYMVTPLVFDFSLKLEAEGWEISKVYGSPLADEATGEIMNVNTLFPSKSEDGEVKGGMILIKLNKLTEDPELKLVASYQDREGAPGGSTKEIDLNSSVETYDNQGIRKAILLARYGNLMKNWLRLENSFVSEGQTFAEPMRFYDEGILIPLELELSRWERRSKPLLVNSDYQKVFVDFLEHLNQEMTQIKDGELAQERVILEKLIAADTREIVTWGEEKKAAFEAIHNVIEDQYYNREKLFTIKETEELKDQSTYFSKVAKLSSMHYSKGTEEVTYFIVDAEGNSGIYEVMTEYQVGEQVNNISGEVHYRDNGKWRIGRIYESKLADQRIGIQKNDSGKTAFVKYEIKNQNIYAKLYVESADSLEQILEMPALTTDKDLKTLSSYYFTDSGNFLKISEFGYNNEDRPEWNEYYLDLDSGKKISYEGYDVGFASDERYFYECDQENGTISVLDTQTYQELDIDFFKGGKLAGGCIYKPDQNILRYPLEKNGINARYSLDFDNL
jgi:Ca-activated chloride channel family protein